MKLLCIRHGQTDFNKNGVTQGQEIDVPLNEEGIRQVELAAKELPGDIDIIIASPLRRTKQSAEIINKTLHKKVVFDDDLKELRYGSLAGKSWPEIVRITGLADAKYRDDNILFDYTKYGGDSADDLKARVRRFLDRAQREYAGKTMLMVTHGGVIDTMHVLFPEQHRIATDNATIHEFRL